MPNVQRIVAQLKRAPIDATAGPDVWIAESRQLAETMVYDPIILRTVREAKPKEKLQPILLPESYMKWAGEIARQRVYMPGLRLAELLNAN